MSELAYGLGAGIFSVGYCLLEVPSNLILSRVGARRWIARILVSWGLDLGRHDVRHRPVELLRASLPAGLCRGGVLPGIVLYLTYWFPARQRARAVALFMVASPLTWIVGGPLSGALLEFMHEWGGLGLAMVVLARRSADGDSGRRHALLSDRSTGTGELADAGQSGPG